MELEITGCTYQKSSTYEIDVAKNRSPPRRAISRTNGTYLMPVDPVITVSLRDTETDRTYELDAYKFFSRMLRKAGLRMSQLRAFKIISYYQSISPFHADYWDVWPEIPNIKEVVK